jgi:glycine/D-amino acid oxidase-like deaminating enzyme
LTVGSAYLRGARIVIIGAGALGSVSAYRLAQAGADVTVVERRFPGAGTTGNSFAWLNSFGKVPRDYHRLNARSMREHLDLARELDGDWVHVDGGLNWAHADNAQHANRLKETARRLHEWGYRIEVLTPEQVMKDIEPDLFIDPDRVEEVYYSPNEGWVNGVGLCHGAISAAVRRYGARIVNDVVVGFDVNAGSIEAVKLASGESLPADAVINAAGPDAARVAQLLGIELQIRRQPGVLVVTEPAPVNLKAVVHAPETFVHADGGWRLLLHREDYDALVESEQPLDISHPHGQQAVENASAILPGLRGIRADGIRMGIRPMPRDGHPIVGFEESVPNFFELVMHSGVTLSATMGMLVTETFLGTPPTELEPYQPSRFEQGAPLPAAATNE